MRELHAFIDRTWPGIAAIERSALEMPELAQIFYGEMRRGLVVRLAHYLQRRIAAGQLRPVPDPSVSLHLWMGTVLFTGIIGWLLSYLAVPPRAYRMADGAL